MQLVFGILLITIFYVYAGYPLLLIVARAIVGKRVAGDRISEPSVTLIVSAYNEEAVIGAKIENSLGLDYPADRLEVIVASDASTDATDVIVRAFESSRIRLIRSATRAGKTTGLNEAARNARGEVLVFSDANAMYEPSAIRMLVRNFDDPAVGAAVGESTYRSSVSDADRSESSYWSYETAIKRLESDIGSTVGGDGAIYAIRKDLYQPMPADALSDFVNPLQIVQQGYRCVYEPEAISVEDAAGDFDKEFRRKVRIVNRAWRATMRLKEMLNPLRYGFFSVQLLSHKVLRWLVPVMLLALLATNVMLANEGTLYRIALGLQVAFYGLALVGWFATKRWRLPRIVTVPYYFCLVNAASLTGIVEYYLGKNYTTWTTARTN